MIVPGRLRRFAQIVPLPRAKLCAICHIDKWVGLWYNISVKRERRASKQIRSVQKPMLARGKTETVPFLE